MKVRQGLLKFVSPKTDREERLRIALNTCDEPLSSDDRITVLFILSHDRDPEVAAAAKKAFEEYPFPLTCDALDKRLDPAVIKEIVRLRGDNDAVMIMASLNPSIDDDTLALIAETGPEDVIGLLALDRDRVLEKPFLLDAIRKNPAASPALVRSLESLQSNPASSHASPARTAAAADACSGGDESIKGDEVKTQFNEQNLYKLIQEMGIGSKVKLALTGNKAARELLVKDANKIISVSVLKNPRITEDEVLKLSSAKGIPEDILRIIGRNKEWIKNYSIRLNMVMNAKTPLAISIKLMDQLFEKDLAKIAKSKNVPSVIASTARRKLELKKDQ